MPKTFIEYAATFAVVALMMLGAVLAGLGTACAATDTMLIEAGAVECCCKTASGGICCGYVNICAGYIPGCFCVN